MTQVVLVVGLPGSGKTHLAVMDYVTRGYVLVDDPKDMGVIIEAIRIHDKVVMTDPHLTRESVRRAAYQWLEARGCEVTAVYFANDPEKAAKNVDQRRDGRGPINVMTFSRFYEIPEGVETLPVYEKP